MPYFRTTDEYLADLITALQSLGSKITDFNVGSGARSLFEVLSASLSNQSLLVDQVVTDTRLATATGDALDAKAADYLVTRLSGSQASGVVRVSRESGLDSILIPSGFRLTTRPVVGQPSVTMATTAEAVMAGDDGGDPDTYVDVPVTTIGVGKLGNLSQGTVVVPESPILGVIADGGYVVQVAFEGGADQEDDDRLRQRVRLEVQGRANGRKESFLAAALGTLGVVSANALRAGDTNEGGTVTAGTVEVYYEGAASLLAAVTLACEGRSTFDQDVVVAQADAVALLADFEVTALDGTDEAALEAAIKAAVVAYVTGIGVGGTVLYASVIRAIMGVPGVISVNVPFNDLRRTTDTDNTDDDVVMGGWEYPTLDLDDITVTITTV